MAIFSRIASFITGGAVARAASDGVSPVLEPVRQHAWQRNRLRVLDPASTARLRAQGLIDDSAAHEEASRSGLNSNRTDALVQMLETAPGRAEFAALLNRGFLDQGAFNEAMAKHQIPPKYWPGLYDLTDKKLDEVQLANAIHRGLIDDPGLLAVAPPTGTGNVPAYPVYPIDALKEAKAEGIDRNRLGVLVGLMGLPMGVHEAAQAVFRKVITKTDYDRAVAEGNTRNEWGDAIFEQTRQIPTARDFFENALRGYHDLAWAQEQAKRHGMSDVDSLVIYQNQGRPMNVHTITRALAKGGTFKPEPGEIRDPYLAAIVEGNLKPAYYDLAHADRYTLPSYFIFKAIRAAGGLTELELADYFKQLGWPPDLADKAAASIPGPTGVGVDQHVSKAQTQLWTTTHSSYKAGEIDDAAVTATLPHAGVEAASIPAVLDVWRTERSLVRATLSAADIRKAFQKQDVNDATGLAWTIDDGVAALMARGWDRATAHQYLEIG